MIESFLGFFDWFFGLRLDAVTLPWVEANKYTLAFLCGAPYLAYRWYRRNIHNMRMADREFDNRESQNRAE